MFTITISFISEKTIKFAYNKHLCEIPKKSGFWNSFPTHKFKFMQQQQNKAAATKCNKLNFLYKKSIL